VTRLANQRFGGDEDATGNVRFAARISLRHPAALGRGRVYAKTISMSQTCRSNWHVTQPTIGADMSGYFWSPATDSFLASHSARRLHARGLIAKIPHMRRWRVIAHGTQAMGTSP